MAKKEKNVLMEDLKTTSETAVEKYSNVLEGAGIENEFQKREIVATLIENQEKNLADLAETNVTGDVSVMDKLFIPMISRAFKQLAPLEIFGNFVMKADTGKAFYMTNHYTNSEDYPVKPADGVFLIVADSSSFTDNGDISSTGDAGVGKVRFIESLNNILFVEIISGSFAAGDSVDNTASFVGAETTVSSVHNSEMGMTLLADYGKFASLALGEAASTNMEEVELKIDSFDVSAEPHKIKSRYTRELLRRLKDYHGLNGKRLISSLGADALAGGINKSCFNLVKTNSITGGIKTWDYDVADGRYEREKYDNLIAGLMRVSNELLQANHLVMGNYIIVDPITHASLLASGKLDTSMLPGKMANPMMNPFVGVLNGMFRVYVNVFETSTVIDMGCKDFTGGPEAETKAGAFFCPYLTFAEYETVKDDSGQPVSFFESFYAFESHPLAATTGNNDFFRRIVISNLPGSTTGTI